MTKKRIFTDQEKELVAGMVLAKCSMEQICTVLKCTEKVLRRECGEEVELAKYHKNAMVARKLYELAEEGDKTALIFLAKTQLRWSERHEYDITQRQAAVQPIINVTINSIDGQGKIKEIPAPDIRHLPPSEAGSSTADESD